MGDKITVPHIQKMKQRGEKITCLTAYDYSFARILDESGVEMLLVGDSLGCVVQGGQNTMAVTMDEMIYHTRTVVRGRKRALVIGDMPFMSYQVNQQQALRNAGRFFKEAGAEAVKLEGGVTVRDSIQAIVNAGMPVMGHVGLTPQSVHQFGGYKIQGREKNRREMVLRDALAVAEAGAFAVVLEGIPMDLAEEITERLVIPTIGIGAGMHCDGQVLVIHDMLGLFDDFTPKFVKRYADVKSIMSGAVKEFIGDVKARKFPAEEHSFR
ncbi:MAG TPA: 3-methyl-2-oxobutanoate hydroxymethyltransferase [Candidatus Limnocylindrales bacterium]|nr:3-methyl-2-oxobutanoate hydroxymethyltransferase [Candidatus Limnocylindrales bacterium]